MLRDNDWLFEIVYPAKRQVVYSLASYFAGTTLTEAVSFFVVDI
jgi:hypothetical protein